MADADRMPRDEQHILDARIVEAFEQHAVADHTRRAEDDGLHVATLQPTRWRAARAVSVLLAACERRTNAPFERRRSGPPPPTGSFRLRCEQGRQFGATPLQSSCPG